MRKNRLKELWREDKPAYGIWADLGSPAAVEAAACCEPDWILLDGEHGAAGYEGCFQLLQAMNGSRASSVVRVPWNEIVCIKRALDMGAEGIMVPYIKTADDVRAVVSACRYPPKGERGIGPFRASRYETEFMEYYNQANDEVMVMVQIENVGAVKNLDAILAVEGLDAIFIGPADLSASMGLFPNMDDPKVQSTIADVLARARAKKIPVGYYCNSGAEALARAKQGFRFISIGNDMTMLVTSIQRELKSART